MNGSVLRERFLRDPLPRRLGNLAANLARIESFSNDPRHEAALGQILLESEHFIEWAAPEAPTDLQADLAELQLLLARWGRLLAQAMKDPEDRLRMAVTANRWSQRLLEKSGLLA